MKRNSILEIIKIGFIITGISVLSESYGKILLKQKIVKIKHNEKHLNYSINPNNTIYKEMNMKKNNNTQNAKRKNDLHENQNNIGKKLIKVCKSKISQLKTMFSKKTKKK